MKVYYLILPCITAVSATISLHHRIFHPNLPALSYLPRGTIDLASGQPVLTPEDDLPEHFAGFIEALQGIEKPENTLYQVALEHEGDSAEALWDFSSVQVCYLAEAAAQTVVLHSPPSSTSNPFALDYFLSPINHDGSCPSNVSGFPVSAASSLESFSKTISTINTTVLLRSPKVPPSPELRLPPQISAEGEVVKPPPEKSFIQKYWMYMVAVLLVFLVSGSDEEPPKRQVASPP
ncbi:hypothetical protein BJ165DRAFT_1422473 [Panaeolus papilionaceus]|nr:hypothetical protein BJ165DRAFT_1422473 [Panaeolus papilionaceus]